MKDIIEWLRAGGWDSRKWAGLGFSVFQQKDGSKGSRVAETLLDSRKHS